MLISMSNIHEVMDTRPTACHPIGEERASRDAVMTNMRGDGSEIRLPFPQPQSPGEIRELAPGLLWLRMPLPLRLNHVNIWLLEEADGWTAIDTGLHHDATYEIWGKVEGELFRGKPLRRLLATHGHTDHCGIAGWMVQKFDVPFLTTHTEWLAARVRIIDESRPISERTKHFAMVHDCDDAMVESFIAHRKLMAPMLAEQPRSIVEIREGEKLTLGQREWRVMVCGGHADAHASLYCENDGILIAGDQILQRISPMIGVFPDRPRGNPLRDYLGSLPRFLDLPSDLLVLPGHGVPFYGLHVRTQELMQHHEERLADLLAHLDQPRSASSCTRHLFDHAVREGQSRLALAETLAHLNYLVHDGQVQRSFNDNGQLTFIRAEFKN